MKYSTPTLDRFVRIAQATLRDAKANINDLHVCISKRNTKIGSTFNVSLLPIYTCAKCSKCKWHCYDIKACLFHKKVMSARACNTAILENDRAHYFAEIDAFLNKRVKHKYFRWHVAGDMIDSAYLHEMCVIARKHPAWIFWTYTKNYDAVNNYIDRGGTIPDNLSIMFSAWAGVDMENKYDFPTFSCRMKGESIRKYRRLYKCPGDCNICKLAHRGCIAKESAYVDEH